LIEEIKKLKSCCYNKAANEENLIDCQNNLFDNDLPLLQDDYIDFLKKIDGFSWNGFDFYGTKNIITPLVDIQDIVSVNQRFLDIKPGLIGKIIIGKSDNDVFTFDYEKSSYEQIDLSDLSVVNTKEKFKDLIKDLINI
jgi:hypothetical protein